MSYDEITPPPLGDGNDDIFDIALREAVRQGRVIRSKNDEGQDVYTACPVN